MFALTLFVAMVSSACSMLGQDAMWSILKFWLICRVGPSGDLPPFVGWAALAGLAIVPATAIAMVIHLFTADRPARFLVFFPIATVLVFSSFFFAGLLESLTPYPLFWMHSPHALMVMLLASLFGLVETLWKGPTISAIAICVLGLLSSVSFSCFLACLTRMAGLLS
jgi:hypothetical protein